MADVIQLLQRLRQREERRHVYRIFRDRFNPFDIYTDEQLFQHFRFRRPTILFIVDLVRQQLEHPTQRSKCLSPLLQVLIFLQFVATGAFHILVGQSFHVSKATAGRCVRTVADAICRHARRFIQFPTGQRALDVKRGFHAIAAFPNVIGCIDGTQVRISSPTENEMDFVNRKGFHSLNVQMVCDPNFLITNCVANWPGSCHDSRVFRESQLCVSFENGLYNGYLLGDSGYPCKRYLLTPFNATGGLRYREKFNSVHCRTRVLIEQTFGILKRRFPCLSTGIRTNPTRACQYIVCCVILHNVGIIKQDIVIDNIDELTIQGPDQLEQNLGGNDGFGIREHIARTYFG